MPDMWLQQQHGVTKRSMKLHSIEFCAVPGMVQVLLTVVALLVMIRWAMQTQTIPKGEQCVV